MTEEKMSEERTKLEAELAKGKQALDALQKQMSSTIATMQRIQGAIQFIDTQTAEKIGDPTPETKDEPE